MSKEILRDPGHSEDNCPRVAIRMGCYACGYPDSEAMYPAPDFPYPLSKDNKWEMGTDQQAILDMDMKRAIICDLDGTLALKHKDRDWYDASTCDLDSINEPVWVLLNMAQEYNWWTNDALEIIFVSGRQEKDREPTEKFLQKYALHGYPLFMRQTGDFRSDVDVKRELYQENIEDKYNILFVLDDRNSEKYPVVPMWRELGLTCFQVAEGNF
jgi:hypothetical protein